jgi:orotidine-5'-phosphate decarboxylase
MKHNPIIIPLDTPTLEQAVELARLLKPYVGAFKIGLELFNVAGLNAFDAVRRAAGDDVKIFYDAKFHDIPNTVAGAVRAAVKNNVWMVNVHATGGLAMMRAAVDAAHKDNPTPPLVIAVTVLTSIDAVALTNELGVSRTPEEQVVALSKLAQEAGCDGVVASPKETAAIRKACGGGFVIVTPGVRPAGASLDDQKRVMTPSQAIAEGATYLVIGRPITASADPVRTSKAILEEMGF